MKVSAVQLFFFQVMLGFCFLQKPVPHYHAVGLYVHIDKNIYMPGETIWFKAYFPAIPALRHETLLVKIVDPKNKKVVIEREFAVYDIRSNGQIVLPDTLANGNYQFMAYGNKSCTINSDNVFTQKISVLKNSPGVLLARAELTGKDGIAPGNQVKVQFGLSKNNAAIGGIRGRFTVTSVNGTTIFANEKFKTDGQGNAIATFTYPDIGTYEHVVVKGEFFEGKVPATATLYLPSQKKKVLMHTGVEGGQLVAEIKNKVLVHLSDENDMPLPDKEVLLKENKASRVSVITDSTGAAVLQFVPKKDAVYTLAAQDATEHALINNGKTVQLKLIDSNNLKVINTGMATQCSLQIASATGVLFTKQLNIRSNDSVAVVLPKAGTNAIISASLFDSDGALTNQRLLVQGTVQPYKVKVILDGATIVPHQKVKASVHIEDDKGNPVKANLSIAAVFTKNIYTADYKAINYAIYSGIASQKQLKYLLQQPLPDSNAGLMGSRWPMDTLHNSGCQVTAAVKGTIVPNKKDKPVHTSNIVLNAGQGTKMITVGKNGRFIIPPDYLLAGEGQENYIIMDKNLLGYATIALDTVSSNMPQLMALAASKPVYASLYNEVPPNPMSGQMQLDEVIISKSAGGGLSATDYQRLRQEYPATCNDYVCIHGIINCPGHDTADRGVPPTIGMRYAYNGSTDYLYTHCLDCANCINKVKKNTLGVKSITLPEVFPEMKFEGSYDVKYYSTLYWNPNTDTNENGNSVIEFTTSDLPGNYSLIIQGINIEDTSVIYGEAAFKVTAGQ